ncbi:hypothetical protein N4C55_004291 [Salmonella enterica]|nr:hypothetical protein [Salmonella enterica]
MKLYIFIPLLILSCCVFYINGFIALIGFFVSLFLFKRNFSSGACFLYLPIVILSAALTIIPFTYKVKDFDINGSVNIQMAALYLMQQTNINDCSQLVASDYGHFITIKEDVINYCGNQHMNDISYFTHSIINVMYSVLYNEFSLASASIPVPKRKNRCLSSIDEFLKVCPEQKIHFSQKNLQMLRDFERKQ